MTPHVAVHEIVRAWLEEHGCAGLHDEDECNCTVGDLFRCEGVGTSCVPYAGTKEDRGVVTRRRRKATLLAAMRSQF